MAGVVTKIVGKRMLKDNKYFKVCLHLQDNLMSLRLTKYDRTHITKKYKSKIREAVLSRLRSRKEKSSFYSSLNMIGKSFSITENGPFDLITQSAMSPA